MTKTIKALIGILFSVTVLSQTVLAQNHSRLTSQHNQAAERFTAKNLKTNGAFDLFKINQFIERLHIEKKALANDMYETKIIEKLELEIESHKDAIKSAKKELDSKKSKYIIAYDQYLIPKMTELQNCVAQHRPQFMCEGIMDAFVDGYAGFYLPEAPRNIFHQDIDPLFIAKNAFGYTYKRIDNKKVEAANLKIESENLARTKACLPEVKVNDILDQTQIQRLQACGVDISIYNPAEDTLWKNHTAESFAEAKNLHEEWFPREDEIIYYKKVKFSSAGSPKMDGEFERDGEDVEVKIKMGFEAHTEITTSILGKMIGMYQDTSVIRKKLRVYFKGDTDYDAFTAQWKRKYRGLNKEFSTYVLNQGQDDHGKYVTLQDVQLSINDPRFLRIAPYDPAGWDLPNRREHRAQVLWFGLVNMIDSKTGNHMLLFEKTDKGLLPRYSFQDVGYSLHFQINPLRPLEVLRSILSWGVNAYDHTFLGWNSEKVHINWADVLFNQDRFNTTTYADLKWMARQIAKLSHNDIKYAVQSADFPPEIEDLYIHKITNRRNEVVRAFDLTSEFVLYPVVDFKTYSPNKKVKKGDVVVSHFDGYVSYELPRNTILPLILQGAASVAKLEILNRQLKAQVANDISVNFNQDLGKVINVKNIGGGIGLELTRSVGVNNQYVMRGDQSQAFVVKDRLAIEINVGSSLFTTLKGLFPDQLAVNANIKVWRREFEFIHFANTWLEGYKSNVKLFNFVPHWKNCIVRCIDRGEVLKISDSYGISAGAKIPVGAVAGVPLTLGASVFWQNSKPTYFSRDQFNQLIIYEAENSMYGYSVTAGLDAGLDLILFNLPFLEFSKSSYFYDHKSALYRFSAPKSVTNFNVFEQMRAKEEQELLNRYFEAGDADPLVVAKKDLDIAAKGTTKKSAFNFLFLFKNEKATGYSKATVKTSNKEVRNFQRYSKEESSLFGANKSVLLIDKMATVAYKDTTKISIELDEAEPDKMVAYMEVWNYERKLNRKGLVKYISDLNKLYSKNANEPFYADYFLPAKEQMDKYLKIYGHTRIYFYGDKLLNALKSSTPTQLASLFAKTYKGNSYEHDVNRFLRAIQDMKKFPVKDQKFLKQYFKVLDSIRISENGVDLVKAVLSDEDMFVMGEIYGVYPSFSTMNQDEQYAGRRFAGKSWGNYKIPPLRKFLNQHSITHESIYINGEIDFDDIFGPLPGGNVEYY